MVMQLAQSAQRVRSSSN